MASHTRSARGEAPSQLRKRGVSDATAPFVVAAREDFSVYMAFVHRTDMPEVGAGLAEPAAHHLAMIDVLAEPGHVLIVAPRGSGKTTLLQGWLEWQLGRASVGGADWAERIRIVYVSNTAHQAYKVANAVKTTVQVNPWYRLCFPGVKPHRDKWSEPEWRVEGNNGLHSNFIAVGVGGPLLGARADIMVFDDTDDEENTRTAAEREKLRSWHEKTALPVLVPGGQAVKIMTRWHEEDTAAWAWGQGWRTLYMSALGEDGRSYWPERFSAEYLEGLRKRGPMSFALQYQNEITPYQGVMFRREWFRNRFDWVPAPEEIRRGFATWDTAGTLTGRSYTVGLVIALTRDWDYYVLHMVRGKLEYPDLKRAIREVAKRWKVSYSLIEAKATGQPALQELGREGLRVLPVLPPGQRGGPAMLDWVEAITIPCEEGRVWLPSREFLRKHGVEDWTGEFLGEVLAYPEGSNDDIVVALTQLLYHVERDKARWEREERMAFAPLTYGRSLERAVAL